MNTQPSRPRAQVKRNFSFLVSYANSAEQIKDAYGCMDFPSFKEAEAFIRDNFFHNPDMQRSGIYIISTYNPSTDLIITDICHCYWRNNMLHEMYCL